MRLLHGLEKIRQQHPERLNASKLAEILLKDLQQCSCEIYGCDSDDKKILLAKMYLLPETLNYDSFDQRLDFCVSGQINRADFVPLVYRLEGLMFGLSGRCSMIPRVCGVDLYLEHSYTGVVGDLARQKFSISINSVLKMF